jgi:hypothetical protein
MLVAIGVTISLAALGISIAVGSINPILGPRG